MARVQLLLEKDEILLYNEKSYAGVAELVDAPHSKCGGAIRAGSSPATGTMSEQALYRLLRFFHKSERAHAAVPPFPTEPAVRGFDWALGANRKAGAIILL